ncbi:MAG: replication-relaxation family protein [Terriglobales bacterium]
MGIVLQERDRRLLEELNVMRVADRDQAQAAAGFGSVTRVNARLLGLTRAGLLRRFFVGTSGTGQKALYTLSASGAQLVGASHRGLQRRKDESSMGGAFVEHQLALNGIYCALKFGEIPLPGVLFRRWISSDVPFGPSLLPDGYLELTVQGGVLAAFVEVDMGTERSAVWEDKVRKYLQLAVSGEFERRFGQSRFRVLIVANSLRRMHSIRKTVAKLTEKIFWFSTLDLVRSGGFFRSVWLRPTGEESLPLVKELP